jgi:uncharacterized protein YecE (DUF72 family)
MPADAQRHVNPQTIRSLADAPRPAMSARPHRQHARFEIVTTIRIGTAGWSIPRKDAEAFRGEGSSLERYASRFDASEINSSFHRPHRGATWERWRDSVPAEFRFSVKLPKQITHQLRLIGCSEPLGAFIEQASGLGEKLGVLLVQLPPKLEFDEKLVTAFFVELAARSPARIACEPRHPSWFTPAASDLLQRLRVARVAADPAICDDAAIPGGWTGLSYWRLHGSPVVYRSSYQDRIAAYVQRLQADALAGNETWCIFDNTASSAATSDALALMQAMADVVLRQ